MSYAKREWYRIRIDFMFATATLIGHRRKIDVSHIKWLLIQESSRG